MQLRKDGTKVARGWPILELPDVQIIGARSAELAEELGDRAVFLAFALTLNELALLVTIVLDEVLGRP